MVLSKDIPEHWSPSQQWLFYFIGSYVILYIIPFPFTFIGIFPEVGTFFNRWSWDLLIPWFGSVVMGLENEINTVRGGSGDTTYFWIQYLLTAILAFLISVILFVIRRSRPNENLWLQWVATYMVYFVMLSMLSYGFVKVIKLQFQDPNLTRLLQPYGHSSPMRLAWTFMGQSTAYTFFAGASEVIAGILLMFRRTRTLGGLVGCGVMLNIFLMNMSYDIPVKLYSFHLLTFCLFIVLLDGQRILNFLVLNRSVPFRTFREWTNSESWNKALRVIKFMLLGAYCIYGLFQGKSMQREFGLGKTPNPPLYGIYEVIEFQLNHELIPPLTTDTLRWNKVVLDKRDIFSYQHMNSHRNYSMRYAVDTSKQSIELTSFQDSVPSYRLIYNKVDDTLYVDGVGKGDTLAMKWLTVDLDQFMLRSRGFHWINEYPYNR